MANAGTSNSENNVGKGGKGAGINNGKSRDYEDTRLARPTAVLQKMVPVLADLDRRVASLEDRSTFVVVLRSEDGKKMVRDVRETWKKSERDRRDALAKKWNDEPAGAHILAPHPLGGSLRVCILRTCLELMLECLNRQSNVDNSAVELLNKVQFRQRRWQKSFSVQNHVIRNLDKTSLGCGHLCLLTGSAARKSPPCPLCTTFGARQSSCLHNTPKMDRWFDGCVTGGIT